MKKALAICLGLLIALGSLQAQSSIDHFTTLESQGQMPGDFKKLTGTDKEYYDYNVLLKRYVMEGRVLYGTPLNDYLNTIVDNLLQGDNVLRSKLHIYIIKSPVVNAYATYNGLVLVNLGMIAQVSNESELAFILAHEISHFAEKHALKIRDYKDSLTDRDYLSYYLKSQCRSREQEMAADRIALERYLKQSPYSYSMVDGIFDVLQYADLPFDEVPFPKSQVETDFYQFPSSYYLANTAPITNRANGIDTLYTHPNIEKRRAAAHAIASQMPNEGRSVFVQSESLFYEIRELARMECINYFLTEHMYDHALYNTYVLQRSHPNNAFLKEAEVTALYGLSKHKNYSHIGDVLCPYKKVEGEMQQTSYFLSKLSRPESSLLALRAAWSAHKEYPDNLFFVDVIHDAAKDVFVKNKMKYTDFSDYPMGTHPDSIKPEEKTISDSITNKYERIRQNNQTNKIIPTSKFKTANYMLVDMHQDPEMVKIMNAVIQEAEDEKILSAVSQPQAADFKTLYVATPEYVIVASHARRQSHADVKGDKCRQKLAKVIEKSAENAGLDAVFFGISDICRFTTEQYNAYAQLQQWLKEYHQAEGLNMCYHQSKRMDAVYDLTGTTKICVASIRRSTDSDVSYSKLVNFGLAAICPYASPFAIATFATPRYSTDMYLVITDFTTGKTILSKHDSKLSSMSEAYVNTFIYDNIFNFVKGK
ncbi:MAG: M48 family metallopeptidase [Bacteroidales bacterium]|nr:M48 family metallopeptidase [Bacteroidales bacterium]